MKLGLIFSIVLVLGFIGLGYMHEQVHVAIYDSYGIESHVEYFSHFPDFVTITEPTNKCTESCMLANNINEAVGYHLIPIYSLIGVGLLILIMFKELEIELKELEYE